MKGWNCKARILGAVGVLAGIGWPVCAQAQGMGLKTGGLYAIGFQDGVGPGPAPVAANAAAPQRAVATYRVLGASSDQQWYRMKMVVRNPQGGWFTPPGASEVWVNMAYAMWVQEVLH